MTSSRKRPLPFARIFGVGLAALLLLASFGLLAQEQPPVDPIFNRNSFQEKVRDFAPQGGPDSVDGRALVALVRHAKHFSVEALQAKAVELPTPEQLQPSTTDPNAVADPGIRFQLVKFTARIVRITKLVAPEAVKAAGVPELYEAKALVADRAEPISLLLNLLPVGVNVGEQPQNAPRAQVAGYFLKVVRYQESSVVGGPAAADRLTPLIVAPTFLAGEQKTRFDFDGSREVYSGIRDFASLQDGNNVAEGTAYADLVRHVIQFEQTELLNAAEAIPVTEFIRRKKVTIPSKLPGMPSEERLKMEREDLRFRLLKVSGRLKKLVSLPVTPELQASGVKHFYEAWLVLPEQNETVCVSLTELPPGIQPNPDYNPSQKMVAAGYFLKMIRYEAGDSTPAKPIYRFAPLFVARTLTAVDGPTEAGTTWRTVFVPSLIIGLALLTALLLGLTWWFRSSDRAARQAVEGRKINPFSDQDPTTQQPSQTGEPTS